jgi:integrase/recombinase XerD
VAVLDPDLLSLREIERLLAQCSRRAPTGLRNRALLTLAYRAGLRCQEALDLKLTDIDLEAALLTVRSGKGGRMRRVGLDAGTVAVIEQWLRARGKLKLPRNAPLLCTLQGRALDASYVRHLMKRLAAKAGIERRAHLHGLRHAFAVSLAREGAPLPVIQRALGHQAASTTSIYLSRVGADESIDFIRSRTWSTE